MRVKNSVNKTEEQIVKEIARVAKDYETFDQYISEAGWQAWMNDYTEANEGDECSESEIEEIEKIQKKGFEISRTLPGRILRNKVMEMLSDYGYRFCTINLAIKDVARKLGCSIDYVRKVSNGK